MESNKKFHKVIFLSTILIVFFAILALSGYLLWTKVILAAETSLKFGFVADFEYGYRNKVGNKLTNKAPEALEKVVEYFNNDFHPEIVISGGDMVESSTSKKDTTIRQFKEINDIFSKLQSRREYVFGNHDLRDLNKEELRKILDIDANHKYFDLGDWRFVLMDTNFKTDGSDLGPNQYVNGYVSKSEFEWLREALNTDKPTILFSHHSSVPSELNGQFVSYKKNISRGIELHNFLKQYKNLVLFASGHETGYKFANIEGLNYIISGNLATSKYLGNFISFNAKYNKYTKEAKIIIQKHGEHAQEFEIKKKIGKNFLFF
ncbi:MAG TPA: metallophosphoesterase [Candidatus Moranbacteria bacterium]|nr:metallophosphoesterase [Candidatus Moranbacteria bacterium]HRZ33892.1 metallophosphoesterase [Candidatus Moranbacteria bacterium]